MTQASLAAAIGVSQQTVARWESGQLPPTKYLRALAAVLNVRVELLLGDEAFDRSLPAGPAWLPDSDEGDRFGTLRLDFSPVGEEEWATAEERASATAWTPDEYPISVGAWSRVSAQLAARDLRVSWLSFETLDNRVVLVNQRQLEAVALISETVEEMPGFEAEELYRALRDPRMRGLLEAPPNRDVLEASDLPFSMALYEDCLRYVREIGGLEEVLRQQSSVVIETSCGYRDSLPLDDAQVASNDIQALIAAINRPAPAATQAPMEEWMLNLHADRAGRATYYRLGALRLIQIPALELEAAIEACESSAFL